MRRHLQNIVALAALVLALATSLLAAGSDGQAGATDVSVTVRNTGSRAGMEVVQVYVTPSHDTLSPPVKRLKRFAKILLNPGESRQLRFRIGEGEETRPFTVRVGSLTREVQ